jgi:hypothetical protein
MQVALNDENVSPLDATLESVMPGVHQRFVATDGHVKALDRKIVSGFEKLDDKVDALADHFTDLQAYNRERDLELADTLRSIAARLGTPAGSTLSPPRTTRPQQVQSPSRGGDQQPSPSPDGARRHRMVAKHHSIQSLWDEWHGLGDFLDKPVVGGIAAIETLYKSKWRTHFSSSEKKHFSRSQIVMRAIQTTCDGCDEPFEETIGSFEVSYEVDAKFSIAKMATIVQNLGLVTRKKSRGKTKN